MTGTEPRALTGGLREGLAAARRGWRPPSPQGDTGSERRGHSPQTTQPACCWVLTGVQAMGTEHGSGSLVLTPGDERGRHRNRAWTGGRWESSLSPRRSEIGAHALAPHGRRWGRAPETRDGQTCRTGRQRRKPTWSMRSHSRARLTRLCRPARKSGSSLYIIYAAYGHWRIETVFIPQVSTNYFAICQSYR